MSLDLRYIIFTESGDIVEGAGLLPQKFTNNDWIYFPGSKLWYCRNQFTDEGWPMADIRKVPKEYRTYVLLL